ncbi:MAG: Cna B-type domain-containing protein [Clostridia bacterium]|nr:Cna B-type domain-containing protein [Clostridia bacterium]
MKGIKQRLMVAILSMLLSIVLPFSFTAAAFSQNKGSITVHLVSSLTDEPIVDSSFLLYRVADVQKKGNNLDYTVVSSFEAANIDIDDIQDSSLAIHLAYFAQSHNLPFQNKITNQKGTAVFEHLDLGLYLVVPVFNEGDPYISSPFMINVPSYDSATKNFNYNITASPKVFNMDENEKDQTYIRVSKQWDTTTHPQKITVVLLRDYLEYATVELNEANNWQYCWENLSQNHLWSVVEKQVPNGYTVQYETSSNKTTIVNKSDKPSVPSKPEEDDKLVQTGQLNWPVPICAIAGLLFFGLGWALLNFSKKDND